MPFSKVLKYALSNLPGVLASMLTATLGSAFGGQACISCLAYTGFNVGSTRVGVLNEYSRFAKGPQCEKPTVCAPESAIMSVIVRLFFLKTTLRRLRLKLGRGMLDATRNLDETSPSRRPSSTLNHGPPDCKQNGVRICIVLQEVSSFQVNMQLLTSTTTSLAARAKISAHETTPGHTDSTACLALITVSKLSAESERFSVASLSASSLGDAIRIEASQPYSRLKHLGSDYI